MKRYVSLFLVLIIMFTLAACGGDGGNKSPSESSVPSAESDAPYGKTDSKEARIYGLGEVAEANGLSITIDGAEPFDYTGMLSRPKDGFEYMKVWFTFKNVSKAPIDSPNKKDIYIIYEEGLTGDDCDMTSEENSQVMSDVADRNERYMEEIELASGESTGGWMVYQRQANQNEVTMHYYSGFVNVAPDLRFRFTLDTSAESTPPAQAETEQAENEQIVDYTGLSLNQIAGAYTVNKVGTDEYYQFEIIENNSGFIVRHANGNESENEYDPNTGVGTRYQEYDDGHSISQTTIFTRQDDTIKITIEETRTFIDKPSTTKYYEGYRED